jgi:dTDP-4-dehydrorhamnose 3,5-epimerase
MPFRFDHLSIPEVILIEAKIIKDERGYFQETFKASEFEQCGMPAVYVQDNHSHSSYGTLRGLHYQLRPQAQGKLVGVMAGRVFDVAVDIRRGASSYGQWVGQELSAQSGCLLYIPPGFAHGFCVLSDEADVVYKVTAEYAPALERGILWNDPAIGIQWPINNPTLSQKDAHWPLLREADNNFIVSAHAASGAK